MAKCPALIIGAARHVRQRDRPHHGFAAGAAHCRDRRSGDAGETHLAFVLLYAGLHGHHFSLRNRPGPIYYGSGYVSRKDFWTLGLIFGAIYLAVLLLIGIPYLRFYLS